MAEQMASASMLHSVDQTRVERANNSHIELTNLVAARLRAYGAIPRCNSLVDLAATAQGQHFMFEMKSTTVTNTLAQVRRGVAQLYEYRYRQNTPNARLVLVVENPLPANLHWVIDYLHNDRSIALLWDGNGGLNCTPQVQNEFQFLL